MTLRRTLVSLCLVAAASSACSGTSALTPPTMTSWRLVALSPPVGETVLRGATVSVSLTVASELPGRLSLSIRDQTGARLLTLEPSVELALRQDTSIQATFVVPHAASSIDVFAYLRIPDTAAPTVIHAAYPAQ